MNEKSSLSYSTWKLCACIWLLFALLQAASYASTDSLAGGTWKKTTHGSLLFPQSQSDKAIRIDWLELITGQPPLQNPRKHRWPLTLFTNIAQEPLNATVVQSILDRGFTQFIRLDTSWIPQALALKEGGSPIIIMDGKGFLWPDNLWPYNLVGDEKKWAHSYPPKHAGS